MNFVKVISTNNFRDKFIITSEDEKNYYCLNSNGEYVNLSKTKIEVDSLQKFRPEEFYRYEDCSKLKNLVLKLRSDDIRENLNELLSLDPLPLSNNSFLDEKENTSVQFFYGTFNLSDESCSIQLPRNKINQGETQLREVVVLVLEEFGNLYLDGQKLREYLLDIRPESKKGKYFWTLNIDYNNLIGVKGQKSFQYYSDEMIYTKNFTNQEQNNNVVDFGVIRKVHELQRDLTRRSIGYTLKKSA